MSITVSELFIHPLKSAAAISMDKVVLDQFGVENDRRWMLVDQKGHFLSQRQLPMMCLIRAVVHGAKLSLSVANMSEIEVIVDEKKIRTVVVWGDRCSAYDCGDEVAKWLSQFLDTRCRLVYFPESEIRQVDLKYANKGDKTGFSDGFPLLLISQASLDDLNERLDIPVSMRRFRPNIVVSGTEPFAEDSWKLIKVGNIVMRVVKPCSRCSIPSVDPVTGLRSVEIIKVLRNYRLRDDKVFFGQNIIADGVGLIETGMKVEVLT